MTQPIEPPAGGPPDVASAMRATNRAGIASTHHRCPGPQCTKQVPNSKLACGGHWWILPASVRDEINAAYKLRRDDPARHMDAIRAAYKWYTDNPGAKRR